MTHHEDVILINKGRVNLDEIYNLVSSQKVIHKVLNIEREVLIQYSEFKQWVKDNLEVLVLVHIKQGVGTAPTADLQRAMQRNITISGEQANVLDEDDTLSLIAVDALINFFYRGTISDNRMIGLEFHTEKDVIILQMEKKG